MKKYFFLLLGLIMYSGGFSQNKNVNRYHFEQPIIVDSSSTIMFPVRNNALFENSYPNIIFYDFKKDSTRKLFPFDTYIREFTLRVKLGLDDRLDNITKDWIFYFVKTSDYNKNGKIDQGDPYILYVSDKHGNNLKALTPENENIISIDLFEKQGFALLKIQKDSDNNHVFNGNDMDFYYVKLDLKTLKLGNKLPVY